MRLEAEGEVDARPLALLTLERGAGAAAEGADGVGLVGAARGHDALRQRAVQVPAQHLRPQRPAGGAAVALGERVVRRGAGPRDWQGRRCVSVGLVFSSPAAAAGHGVWWWWEIGGRRVISFPFCRFVVSWSTWTLENSPSVSAVRLILIQQWFLRGPKIIRSVHESS